MKKAIFALWGLVALALIGFAGVYFFGNERDVECVGALNIAGEPNIGGPFTAIDTNGNTVTEADVITGPTLVYFGYTFCPDVCPIDTARNAEVADLTTALGIPVLPVFVTVDPERDKVESLGDYVKYTHPDMIGITGSEDQIEALKKAYRVTAFRDSSDDEYYTVSHTVLSYLMSPDGFVAVYGRELSAEQITTNIQCNAKKFDW